MLRIVQRFILATLFAAFASQASAMFIQADWFDPSDPTVGTNRYAYSHNDPINLADPGGNVPYNPGGSTSTEYHDQDYDYETHTSWTDHRSTDYEQHNYGSNYGGGGVSYGVHTATGPANYDCRSQGIGVPDRDRDRTDFRSSGDFDQYSSYDFSNPGSSGQAVSADGTLYGIETPPAGTGLSVPMGVFGLMPRAAPVARSLSVAATLTTLQIGGRTLSNRTGKALNRQFGTNLNRREWGQVLERLKDEVVLRNDSHGKNFSDGSYGRSAGDIVDDLGGYLL